MQRRHFEAVARAVRDYSRDHVGEVVDPAVLAGYLASEIRQFNGDFDRDRFITACVPEWK